ncbi:PTS galactosamine/N-acetylgalactosamine transporter subunit IIA [Escherichia coli]
MLSIILTGHGGFASGMEKAMKQILGEQSQFIAIDFPETSSTALLTSQLEEAIAQLDCEDGIVFLTDLLGGTPFRVASTLAMQKPGCEVITGTNLQLLLEMVAGSTLSVDAAVRNMVELTGVTPAEAIHMASLHPARMLGVDGVLGSLKPGKRASVVALDSGLHVQQIWIQGQLASF